MGISVLVTEDFNHMSEVAADIVVSQALDALAGWLASVR